MLDIIKEGTKKQLKDYNRVLELREGIGVVYNNRAISKFNLNDISGACLDLQSAHRRGYSQGYYLLYKNCSN